MTTKKMALLLIIAICVISTYLVFAVSALVTQRLMKKGEKENG